MKKAILSCLMLLACQKIIAQADSTFYMLDKSSMQTNVLYPYMDKEVYWGAHRGVAIDTPDFQFIPAIVRDIEKFVVDTINPEWRYDSLFYGARQLMEMPSHVIPIAIINIKYDRVKEYAVDSNLILFDSITQLFVDVNPRTSSPFEEDSLFIFSPMKEKFFTGTFHFKLSQQFLVTNRPLPSSVEIDFDDGLGYRPMQWEEIVAVNYVNGESKNFR
ncbi:MAG: hypothetical protein IPO27_06945 [Bacteroidetes bacterium]|nr:hypothetical protein [Bacteroidota bacterium]